MGMKSVLVEEVELISLSREEVLELERLAKGFIASLKKAGVRAFVGGSLAKGTLVRRDVQDIDVFVVFDLDKLLADEDRLSRTFGYPISRAVQQLKRASKKER